MDPDQALDEIAAALKKILPLVTDEESIEFHGQSNRR